MVLHAIYHRISHHYHILSHHHHHDPPPPQQGAPKSRQELDRRQWILQVDARLPHLKKRFASLSRLHRQASLLLVLITTHPSLLTPALSPASRDFSCRHPRLAHKVMQSIYNPKPHLFYNCKPLMFGIPSTALRVLMQRRAGFVTSRGSTRSSAMHRIRHIRRHPSSPPPHQVPIAWRIVTQCSSAALQVKAAIVSCLYISKNCGL